MVDSREMHELMADGRLLGAKPRQLAFFLRFPLLALFRKTNKTCRSPFKKYSKNKNINQ